MTTTKNQNRTASSPAEVAAAQEAHDKSLLEGLAAACTAYVQGSVVLLDRLVSILTADAWTRHAACESQAANPTPPSSFRAWAVAYMVAHGLSDACARLYATAADGAYAFSLTNDTRGWKSCTTTLLGNIGRASDPFAAAVAVSSAKSPKGKLLGGDAWTQAIKLAPEACAPRDRRETSGKKRVEQVARYVLKLCGGCYKNARILLQAAADHLQEEATKKPVG